MDEEKPPTAIKVHIPFFSKLKTRFWNRWFLRGTFGLILGVVAVVLLNQCPLKWNGSLDAVALILGAFGTLSFAILTVFKIKIYKLPSFLKWKLPALGNENQNITKRQFEKFIAFVALISLALSFAIQIYLHFLI